MSRVVFWAILTLASLPQIGLAASLRVEALGPGSNDQEHPDDPPATPASPVVRSPSEPPKEKPAPVRKDPVPATHSITLDLGAASNVLGGWAYPKIKLHGRADPDNNFYPHGLGPGFKLHWDFPASDVDWRIGIDGTWPAFMALEATVGIRRDLAPWRNPRVIARAAFGLELMLGGRQSDSDGGHVVYLVPAIVGKGEVFLELTAVENLLSFGVGLEVGARYGIPLGIGFDVGPFLRTEIWF